MSVNDLDEDVETVLSRFDRICGPGTVPGCPGVNRAPFNYTGGQSNRLQLWVSKNRTLPFLESLVQVVEKGLLPVLIPDFESQPPRDEVWIPVNYRLHPVLRRHPETPPDSPCTK